MTAKPQKQPTTGGQNRELKIVIRPVTSLKPRKGNPRTHTAAQVRKIAGSIRQFGFTNPVLVDGQDRIVAGHGRVEAAKLLGIAAVPTIGLEDLSEAQVRAYVIADNRLAELAGWDRALLAAELGYIAELDVEYDLTLTGFEVGEIDQLFTLGDSSETAPEEIPVADPDAPAVSRAGDLWHLGPHRLLCGDATDPAAFDRLLGEQKAQMAFIDPPYNVRIDGHVSGLGNVRHREFAMASGEMAEAEFTQFLSTVFKNLVAYSLDGSIHYVCMDWRHIFELMSAGRAAYSELKNLCVWNKTNGGMGSLYRSKHELVFVFKNSTAPHINNVELGRHGRNRTNVWDYPGANVVGSARSADLAMHPTVKPVALIADAIRDCSRRNGIVLDCFAGSGSTLMAAQKTGRRGYAIELDPLYVDTAIRRWEAATGKQAVLDEDGAGFAAVAERRSPETPQAPTAGESDG